MLLKVWAKNKLMVTTPFEISLWHWSNNKTIMELKKIIQGQGTFRQRAESESIRVNFA